MSDEDIDALAAFAYADGTSPIDWAISLTGTVLEVTAAVVAGRALNPDSFPGWGNRPLTTEAIAGRVIAALMDAGWTPPSRDQVEARVAKADAATLFVLAELEAGRVPPSLRADFGDLGPAECRRLAEGMRRTMAEQNAARLARGETGETNAS